MEQIFLTLALGLAVSGGYTDVRTGKVYNLMTYPAMLVGIGLHVLSSGTSGLFFSLQGIGVGLGFLLLPYLIGVLGGGDVKLLMAVGSFVGPVATFSLMLMGAVAGGLLALGLLLRRRQLAPTLLGLMMAPRTTLQLTARGKRDFPFAVTIPLGLMLWMLTGGIA